MATTSPAQVLSPGVGWAVVTSLAVGFSVLMLAIIFAQQRYAPPTDKDADNDEFSSASRSVKPGLIAAGIVSAWTWSATLLQSAAVAYKTGIAGPVAYAAGACVQVLLFAIIAANLKLNAPFANTFLQVARVRWGKAMHILLTTFSLGTNVLVSSMLILGGSATVHQLTGMPVLAAVWLTPIGIAGYVLIGGLRSSLIADYTHTAVLVALILAFAFTVYSASPKIGSFSRMVELLEMAPKVEGNAGGSYITMRSRPGLLFGIINVMGNFSAVFADQSYCQRAIASRGASATKGFILGGLAWVAIPLGIASVLGLAARALTGQDPAMAILTAEQVSQGLPAPAAAAALLGKSGALMMLFMLFLAVTSASAAQLVAVSSVVTFDIWQPYIRPGATARELFVVSHAGIAGWAVAMAVLGTIWNYVDVSMGYLYTAMGIIVGPCVVSIFCCTTWSRANRMACFVAPLVAEVAAIAVWLGTSKALEGEVSITSTSADYPLVAGNLIAVLLPALIIVPWSMLKPEAYDWEATRAINAPWTNAAAGTTPSPASASAEKIDGGKVSTPQHEAVATLEYDRLSTLRAAGLDPAALIASRRVAIRTSLIVSFILLILVPAMACIPRVFSLAGFGVWVSLIIGWLFVSAGIVVLYPVWESREALRQVAVGIMRDLSLGRSS